MAVSAGKSARIGLWCGECIAQRKPEFAQRVFGGHCEILVADHGAVGPCVEEPEIAFGFAGEQGGQVGQKPIPQFIARHGKPGLAEKIRERLGHMAERVKRIAVHRVDPVGRVAQKDNDSRPGWVKKPFLEPGCCGGVFPAA